MGSEADSIEYSSNLTRSSLQVNKKNMKQAELIDALIAQTQGQIEQANELLRLDKAVLNKKADEQSWITRRLLRQQRQASGEAE